MSRITFFIYANGYVFLHHFFLFQNTKTIYGEKMQQKTFLKSQRFFSSQFCEKVFENIDFSFFC